MSFIIGIDPGFSGACAIYNLKTQKLIDVFDLPIEVNSYGKMVNSRELEDMMFDRIKGLPGEGTIGVFEKVHSMPDQSAPATFNFGFSAGIAYATLGVFCRKIIVIDPAVWKGALNLSSNKQESLELARKLFPEFAVSKFKLKKHDGRAEAALLCHFAAKFLNKD